MSVQLDHTIIWCGDKQQSATFLADLLGRPAPTRFGPFFVVQLDNGVSLDFIDGEVSSQHYAFLIGEEEFDQVFARLRERKLEHWADPGKRRAGAIYHHDGGRGVYFDDLDGHLLEVLTRPYGSGGEALGMR